MQKEIDKCKKDIQCIESFLENLSQTIKALEMNQQNTMQTNTNDPNDPSLSMRQGSQFQLKLAAGRFKSYDPQNCLSCGDFELTHVQNKGLQGIHAKNGSSIEFSRKSTIASY